MQIRNALIILMRILPHFPMLVKLAQIIERKVEKVCFVYPVVRNQNFERFFFHISVFRYVKKSEINDKICLYLRPAILASSSQSLTI